MRLLFGVIGALLSAMSIAQDYEVMRSLFLREIVLGDSIDLKHLPKKPIQIDTAEFFKHMRLEKYSSMELSINDLSDSNDDNIIPVQRNEILEQIENNNNFEWKDLNSDYFYTSKRGRKTKNKENYSLPLFYNTGMAILYRSWQYAPSFSGMSIEFWKNENGMWVKVKSEILWMS